MSWRAGPVATVLLGISVQLVGQTPVGAPAPDLVLRDQYDSTFALGTTRGTVVVLVCGDRRGNRYMAAYSRAVRERFPGVRVVSVANLRGVPSLMRGMVRGRFRGEEADGSRKGSVLLDWTGAVARHLGWRSDLTNVYVIDASGVLRFRAAGAGTGEEVAGLLAAVGQVVASPGGAL